jgi:chemotaxis protein CheD
MVLKREQKTDVIVGFEHIRRHWDAAGSIYSVKVLPGEYYITRSDEMIVTVLGSCIAACVRDKSLGVGGMNHFMLPIDRNDFDPSGTKGSVTNATRYGNYAMEHLINDIIKQGGRKENLEFKIFGGGRIMNQMANVGWNNIGFVFDYLYTEGYKVFSQDIGDIFPRKVIYYPYTGKVRVKKLRSIGEQKVVNEEQSYMKNLGKAEVEGDVELF